MSSILDSGYYNSQRSEEKCKSLFAKILNKGEHDYKVNSGSWPSCEMKCKYCNDIYYTK
jgi:hypothetical protein